jgi:hypothetical protein
MMKHKRRRLILVILEAFIGLSAIGGGIAILTNAFDFDHWLPIAWLAGTPFSDYTIPGLLLLIVIGGGMLLAASTVFIQQEWAGLLSATMGLVMLGFEVFEVAIIDRYAQAVVPSTVAQQALMSGLALAVFGLASSIWMSEYRPHDFPIRPGSHE